jgi:hypothetical protein
MPDEAESGSTRSPDLEINLVGNETVSPIMKYVNYYNSIEIKPRWP